MNRDGVLDQPIELEFYYDVNDEAGNYMVFIKTGDHSWVAEPILKAKNPCSFEIAGERVPFLPGESMFFMALPSVRMPIGVAENTLPSQLAVWRADRMARDIIDRGAGFYTVVKGSVKPEERQKFEKGETAGILYVDSPMRSRSINRSNFRQALINTGANIDRRSSNRRAPIPLPWVIE